MPIINGYFYKYLFEHLLGNVSVMYNRVPCITTWARQVASWVCLSVDGGCLLMIYRRA